MTAKWQYKQAYEATLVTARDLKAENTNLRERITTQKQTIQAYRDESREWRGVAECAQAENDKLRELAMRMYTAFQHVFPDGHRLDFEQDMRELGVMDE